jgi:2-oxoglutarate dehydrogenase E1 component
MTPKKFLRIETSTVEELSTGSFQHVMDDPTHTAATSKSVTQVVYCTGKIYHEMNERREKTGRADVALVRIEQLYPFHTKAVKAVDERYPKAAKRMWAQEEPRNQGAYLYIADKFLEVFGWRPQYIGRAACASPATASEKAHAQQQDTILSEAVAPLPAAAKPADDHHAPSNGVAPTPAKSKK